MFKYPGEIIDSPPTLKLGEGIKKISSALIAVQAGLLENSKSEPYILSNKRRYYPRIGDYVVGFIVSKHVEHYRIDIGSSFLATLDLLAFENASKRNRPNLSIDAIVYCRIVSNDADFEPELVCVNGDGKSDGFGELVGGIAVNCSLRLAKCLQEPDNLILKAVSGLGAFEIISGVNGKVFIKSESIKIRILLANLINECDGHSLEMIKRIILKEIDSFSGR